MKTTSTALAVTPQALQQSRARTLSAMATSALVLGAAVWMAASSAQAQTNESATPRVVSKPDARAIQAQMHGSAHAKLGQKAKGSGVITNAETAGTMHVGQPTRMTLTFHGAHMPGASATVQAPQGVNVTRLDGTPVGEIALNVGRPTRLEVWVTAPEDGMQYLDVTTLQDGRSSVRSLPMKVGSGAVKLKGNGQVVVTPSGETVVSMPAETNVGSRGAAKAR